MPELRDNEGFLIAHDGARLGLTVWPSAEAGEAQHVIVGIHGMNNYAGEFRLAAPEWAKAGVPVYAYDQRGFGRSVHRGHWAGEALMQEDLRTAVSLARARHPGAVVTVVAISMGAAVAITAFASDRPPEADRLILSGPGLRGWGALNPAYAGSLRVMNTLSPGLVLTPPAFVKPVTSDNRDFISIQNADPLHSKSNRVDQLFGAVSMMEQAHRLAPRLSPRLPVLASYGAHDAVVPAVGPRRTVKQFPEHVRTVYYPEGYHILLSDLQRDRVIADYLAFIRDPGCALPSGEGEWPFR